MLVSLVVLLLLVLGITETHQRDEKHQQQPNILLIVADDVGWHDVGYHASEIRTPTLDRLARTGVQLDNYYVQTVCSPSRAELLSGKMQIHTGIHECITPLQPIGLPLELPTLADALSDLGYATHAVGKWHVGYYQKEYLPTYRGFDSFYGMYLGSGDYFSHTQCSRGSCGLDFHWDTPDNLTMVPEADGRYSTALFAKRAQKLIKDHVEETPDKPLFLYVAFQAVHSPLQVPSRYKHMYPNIDDYVRRTYAGMVTCMDDAIQDIVDAFELNGLWDNTVLVFTTDNGGYPPMGGDNTPLKGLKHTFWEGGVKAVGFVNSPLLKRTGVKNQELIDITDWFPTLLFKAGGQTRNYDLDGVNVWDTISEGNPSLRAEILHGLVLNVSHGSERPGSAFDIRLTAALRMGKWKLLTGNPWWTRGPPDKFADDLSKNLFLYNIDIDPTESTDVADDNKHVVAAMLDRLQEYASSDQFQSQRYPEEDTRGLPDNNGGYWRPWHS